MIRNIIVISPSGLVLFSKELDHGVSQPRLIGSLLTAMLEFSSKVAGVPVSYIQLTNVAVSIAVDPHGRANCALFHDVDDGYKLGELISCEILRAFVTDYEGSLNQRNYNLREFYSFHSRITEIIQGSFRPLLTSLSAERGIETALLAVGDSGRTYCTSDVDNLGVAANLLALIGLTTDLMAVREDCPVSLILEGTQTRQLVYRMEHATLVAVCHKSVDLQHCRSVVEETTQICDKVFGLLSSLRSVDHNFPIEF